HTRVPTPSPQTGTPPDTPAAPDAGPRCTSRHGHCCAPVRAHAGLAHSRCTACRPRNGRCRRSARTGCSGPARSGNPRCTTDRLPGQIAPDGDLARTPTRAVHQNSLQHPRNARGRKLDAIVTFTPFDGGELSILVNQHDDRATITATYEAS